MTGATSGHFKASRGLAVGLGLAAIGVGVASLAIAIGNPGATFAGRSPAAAGVWLAAGAALSAAALYLSAGARTRRAGVLFGGAAIAWFLGEWNNPTVDVPVVFTAGLVARGLPAPVIAHAVLAYPRGRVRSGFERAVVGIGYVAAFVVGPLSALFFEPAANECRLCPPNVLLVANDPGVFDWLNRLGFWLLIGWAPAAAALAAAWVVRTTPAARRLTAPVLLAGSAYLLLIMAASTREAGVGPIRVKWSDWLSLAEAVAVVMIGLGVAWSWVVRRRSRAQMAELVVELGRSPPPGGLQVLLARALGDPGLAVAYPIDGRERPVDAAGRVVVVPEGRIETPLVRDGRTVAVLVHRPGLLDDAGVVDEVVGAARLGLDHERFSAEARARIEDLRASRARIVATSDAERRRLERDLHDGAQQRLVELSLAIGLSRAHAADNASLRGVIDEAEERIRGAIGELRDVAHGIYPAVLSTDGLAAAIDALREHTSLPISLVRVPGRRCPPSVESAAYFLVFELTGPFAMVAGATRAVVDADQTADVLGLTVTLDGMQDLDTELEATLVDLQDRVGALDGSLSIQHDQAGSLVVRAEIPCAS